MLLPIPFLETHSNYTGSSVVPIKSFVLFISKSIEYLSSLSMRGDFLTL